MIVIHAIGTPAPQGSKRAFMTRPKDRPGRPVVVEQGKAKVRSWRQAVLEGLANAPAADRAELPLSGPVVVTIVFRLHRPVSHYGTGRNAATLRPAAPARPAKAPDLDKLARATLDALTDGKVWLDDGQVVDLLIGKWYADRTEPPGAYITISERVGEVGIDG